MKILGISGSPRKESQSGTYKLVETVLENTGVDYDLVSLKKKHFLVHCLPGMRKGQCL
jgi:multimeric flavodoxin WrbA